MKFDNSCVIKAPCSKLWDYLTDIPKVAGCLPGVEEVNLLEPNKYAGVLTVKVGIIKLKINGKIAVDSMDQATHTAAMSVQANDHRISGMIHGKLTMKLEELGPQETKLLVGTDIDLMGKIGEFGQPIIRKKADQMMAEFAENVAKGVGAA